MLRATIADLKNRHAAFDAWVNRHWATLSICGYALAFVLTFGGAALAAYHSGLGPISAALCGVLAIIVIRGYVRAIPAMQRLIDRLHPEPDDPAKPDEIPGWAGGVHLLIGFALAVTVFAFEDTYTYAPMELFIAWAAGRNLLNLFWQKRDGTTAFDAFDDQLDALATRHRARIDALITALRFALLSGGVAVHAYECGLAELAAARCAACRAISGFPYVAAAAFGLAAILLVALYARAASSVQRALIDPYKFVRPEPPSTKVPFWVVALHVLIGIVLFIAMAAVAQRQLGRGSTIDLGNYGALTLILGWWIGGRGVLGYFWSKLPRGGGYARAAHK